MSRKGSSSSVASKVEAGKALEKGVCGGGNFVGAAPRGVADAVLPLFDRFEIGEDQLKVDGLDVPHGIDGAFDMGDVFILETADNVHDRVHLADVREEFIAEPLAAARTLHEPCDVHEFDDGGRHLFARIEGGETVEPFVGHGDHADVGLNGAEGIICRLGTGAGNGVEQGGFADIGQTHNS